MDREEQNRMIARAILRDVTSYTKSNQMSFNRFLERKEAGEDGLLRAQKGSNMLKNLSQFNRFDVKGFLADKSLVFLKADPWEERSDSGEVVRLLGAKVSALIARDDTDYGNARANNFGETLIIKVRANPSAFSKLTPMQTELSVGEVERAAIYGQYRNELSLIASVEVAK